MTNKTVGFWSIEDGKNLLVTVNEIGQAIFEIETINYPNMPSIALDKFRVDNLVEFLTKEKI